MENGTAWCDGGAPAWVTDDPVNKMSGRAVSNSGTRGRANNRFNTQFTMATINAKIDVSERSPSSSNWVKFKRWILKKIEKYAICGSQCDFEELALYRTDQHVRACVRAEMREHVGYRSADTCVANAIQVVREEMGYDLADGGLYHLADDGKKRTMAEWDAHFARLGVDPINPDGGKAKIVPKFAAACALHLRSKLGALANNEANVLLVQRKYLEICRKHRVRDVDTVLHQQFVMNAVFTESVLDDIATSRRRLPKWVAWLEEVPSRQTVSASVC